MEGRLGGVKVLRTGKERLGDGGQEARVGRERLEDGGPALRLEGR